MDDRVRGSAALPGRAPRSRRRLLRDGARVFGALGLLAACGTTTTSTTTGTAVATTSAAASRVPSSAATTTASMAATAAPSSTTAALTATSSVATPALSSAAASSTSAAATAAVAATTTATPSVSSAVAAPGSVTLTLDFWNPAGDKNGKAIIADQVARFIRQNPGIQLKDTIVDNANNYEKYTAALAGGAPPDAIMTYDYDPLPGWAYGNAIMPLDAYMAEMQINQSDYFPVVWPMLFFKGHLWGFMQEFDAEVFAWNKALFAKNGLDPMTPPKTIAELEDLHHRFTQKDPSGAITQLGICPSNPGSKGGHDTTWIAMFGGMYYDTLKGQFTITREENAAALDWMAGLWKRLGGRAAIDAYNKAVNGQDGFGNGKQAMGLVTEHIPYDWKTQFPALELETALLPVQSGVFYGTGAAGGGNLFVVPKGVPHVKESISVVKFMAAPAQVLEWNVRENNLPPVKSVALDPAFAKQVPDMHAFLQMLTLSADQNHLTGPITHPSVGEFNKLKDTTVNAILDGKYPAQQGLQQLDQQFKPILDKYSR